MKEMQKIRERLAATKPRSAWDKGVKEIAECLLDKYEGSDPVPPLTEKLCLTVRTIGNNTAMAVAQ